MDYSKICDVYEKLEGTTKGLEKAKILAGFLGEIREHPEYIYLAQGQIFPDYDARELGMSAKLMIRAIAKASGHEDRDVINEFKRMGDLGKVAEELVGRKKRQRSLFSSRLSVEKVLTNLKKLPELEEEGRLRQRLGMWLNYYIRLLLRSRSILLGR